MFGRRVAAACAVLLAAAGPAAADARPRVAVLEVSLEGDAQPGSRAQLERSLAGGLYAAGYDVVPRDEAMERLKGTPELIGCTSTTCLQQIGELLGVTRFVRARVEKTGFAQFDLSIELLGADVDGALRIRREAECTPCTDIEANDAMSRLAAQLDESTAADVLVSIRTRPPGAELSIDGSPAGESPREVHLPIGDHVVEARKPGFSPARTKISVVEQPTGGSQEVVLDLAAPSRFGAWKWVAAGGAVASLAAGIYLVSIDGDCTESVEPGVECPQLWNTAGLGIGLTGLGVAAAGVAVWMFLTDRPGVAGTEGEGTALVPIRGGAMGVWTIRF